MPTKKAYSREEDVKVLGIPFFSGNVDRACTFVLDGCREEVYENRCVSATGAHGMVISKKDQAFKETLLSFYLNLPDGMPGVWVGRRKGAKNMERCSGPLFFERLMAASANENVTHFFCGGKEGVADELKKSCEEKFQNSNVVGTFCPPFKKVDEFDYAAIAEEINAKNPDVVWIGLSTPKQEVFARNLAKFTTVKYIVTVGAAFDFHTGKVKTAPKFIQKIGMEWFYRMCSEPRRLFKRYFEVVPKFIFYAIGDLMRKEK